MLTAQAAPKLRELETTPFTGLLLTPWVGIQEGPAVWFSCPVWRWPAATSGGYTHTRGVLGPLHEAGRSLPGSAGFLCMEATGLLPWGGQHPGGSSKQGGQTLPSLAAQPGD